MSEQKCKYCGSEMRLIGRDDYEVDFICDKCGVQLHVLPLKDIWESPDGKIEVIE